MVIYKNIYLIPFLHSLFYIEGNLILTLSNISTKKFKNLNFLYINNRQSLFFIYRSIITSFSIFDLAFKSLVFFLNDFVFGSLLGYTHGFRLIGRGYKIYLHLNNFLFRLGYSHNIYYVLPFYIKGFNKPKLKKFWIIKGLNSLVLSKFIYSIRSFKIPNMYMYKGIYPKNNSSSYNTKSTKIGFL